MARNTKKRHLLEALQDKESDPFAIKEGRFRFGQLKDSVYYSDWTEQSFLSDSSNKEIITRSFNFSKLKYFALITFLALALIFARTIWLQIIKGNYYYLLSEDNRLRAETIEPKRGIIYDRNLKPLVRNKANFVLYLRPIDLPKNELIRDELIRQISAVLDGTDQAKLPTASISSSSRELKLISDSPSFYTIKELLATVKLGSLESYQPLFIQDNIDYDKAMLISLRLPQWPGVFLTTKIRREYLTDSDNGPVISGVDSLAHILGYTGKINETELKKFGAKYSLIDYVGKVGIEYSWEAKLKGEAGRKNIEVDALGRQKKIINEIPAQDGANLMLALDLDLQEKAAQVAQVYLDKYKLKKASIIIMNPQSGEIRAMVSLPAYDNNAFAAGISHDDYNKFLNDASQPLFNRSISGEFPSGSTIKPIFAAGALQEGVINENTSFLSNGGLRIGEWFFPDWKAGGHGMTDVKKAIAMSVNTFFYYIGGGYGDFKGLGLDGLVKYARLFGLGEKTGIDLNGEVSGFVPTAAWKEQTKNEPWYIGDTYHFAIGQGDVLVTPLQVANYTAAIANGGTLYQPHLVAKILDSNNQLIQEIKPQVIRQNFINTVDLNIVREGMRQTVTSGSGRYLNTLPVTMAGKTGTAQWSTVKAPHAWFIGFAPYENPELSISILVEEGVEGSTVAVPIAYDIFNWYFSGHNQTVQ
ncbi:MAG: penicillin-binding protein 2 [Candidatus Falkowbacteria bacterium]|nr:MAG: penicillin-binding protein 2 [Candidatus Falkowbacteria bacterium]